MNSCVREATCVRRPFPPPKKKLSRRNHGDLTIPQAHLYKAPTNPSDSLFNNLRIQITHTRRGGFVKI